MTVFWMITTFHETLETFTNMKIMALSLDNSQNLKMIPVHGLIFLSSMMHID